MTTGYTGRGGRSGARPIRTGTAARQAVIFGSAALLATWGFGAGIECMHARMSRADLKSTVDGMLISAVLAADEDQATAIPPRRGARPGRDIRLKRNDDGSVSAVAVARYETTFWRLVGRRQFVITLRATAHAEAGKGGTVIRIVRDGALRRSALAGMRDLGWHWRRKSSPGPVSGGPT